MPNGGQKLHGFGGGGDPYRPKHVHKFKLMIRSEEDVIHEPDALASGTFHLYAECECGRKLDREEIEYRINYSG